MKYLRSEEEKKVLVIAPHPDDEILGAGGTIAKRVNAGYKVYVCIVTKGYPPLFDEAEIEKGRQEACKAHRLLGVSETFFLDFPAVRLEEISRHKLNGRLTELVSSLKPEEVYIPHRGDMQLDHQMVVDAAMVALRPKYRHRVSRVYMYETLSETGWNVPNVQNEFIPTVYEDITCTLEIKIEAMKLYESQLEQFPNPRSLKALRALAEYRGAVAGLEAAEAFSLVREVR